MKMKPSNNEFDKSIDNLLFGLEEEVRIGTQSKTLKIVVNSPQSKIGVQKIIDRTNGLVETELEVEYFNDEENIDVNTKKKSTGRISDNQMSQAMDVELFDDLNKSNRALHEYCLPIDSLHVKTPNNKHYYEYIAKRNIGEYEQKNR